MNWSELFSIASSLASTVLAVVSLGLSILFYVKTKDTEQSVTNALAAIKAQTETLQKISGRYLDRLTRYVTEPRNQDYLSHETISALTQFPTTLHQAFFKSQQEATNTNKQSEMLDLTIMLYLYIAVTNVYLQGYLPNVQEFDEQNSWHVRVREIIDSSYQNFQFVEEKLHSFSTKEIQENYWLPSYNNVQNDFRHLVKNTSQTFVAQAKVDN